MQALDAPAPRAARSRWAQAWPLALAAACALAAVFVGARWLRPAAPLSLEVQGGGSAFAATTKPVELAFSDGSSVELAKAARGRIMGLEPQGAEVLLQSGRAKVHVNPR